MNQKIRILHLEDDVADAELIQATLEASEINCEITRVETREEFSKALREGAYDIILADYTLPMYDGMSALQLVRESGLNIPFIFVSGAMGEDAAINALTRGSTDYVLKQKLSRLVPAVHRAIHEAAVERERKQAAEALRTSEERFRTIVENSPIIIFSLDRDGVFTSSQGKGLRKLELKSGEVVGRSIFEVYGRNDQMIQNFNRAIAGENFIAFDEEAGFVFETRWTPILGKDGKVDRVIGVSVDITERKKAEDGLRESESKYRMIVETASEGIWMLGPDLKTSFVNARVSEMTGYSAKELISRPITDFMFAEDVPDHNTRMEVRRQGVSESYERRIRHKNGKEIWFHISAIAVFDDEHRFQGTLAMFTDITERKWAGEALKKSRDHLEELVKERTSQLEVAKEQAEFANRAKSTFLSNMSHELRTPLNAILGFARLMKEARDVTSEQRKNLDIITLSGRHLLNLINNVLDISKIESGRMTLEITSIDLCQLIQEMKSLLYVNAEERGLSFIVEQAPGLPRRIEVDGGKLRQILINLIGNAIKYTKKGSVVLRALIMKRESAEKIWLRFEVEDTGPGISDQDRKRIFQPFVQLRGLGAVETGTGLGLAISRQYVEIMGGRIDVNSEKDKGSVFFFEIPVKELPVEEMAVVPKRGHVIGLEKGQPRYRLLIAEDQLENRILLHKILEPFDFDIMEAADGKEAIEIFEQWHPDLIWMDIRMPVMDGLEATYRIKSTDAGSHTKIIGITAQALEEDRMRSMQVGCDDFIRKPYRDTEIFDALAKHLDLRFVYEEKLITPKKPEIELRPEQLAVLPSDLIKKLHLAVLGLDPERIQEVIEQIMQYDPAIGRALQKLANRFDYDHLLKLLDEYAKKPKESDGQK